MHVAYSFGSVSYILWESGRELTYHHSFKLCKWLLLTCPAFFSFQLMEKFKNNFINKLVSMKADTQEFQTVASQLMDAVCNQLVDCSEEYQAALMARSSIHDGFITNYQAFAKQITSDLFEKVIHNSSKWLGRCLNDPSKAHFQNTVVSWTMRGTCGHYLMLLKRRPLPNKRPQTRNIRIYNGNLLTGISQ